MDGKTTGKPQRQCMHIYEILHYFHFTTFKFGLQVKFSNQLTKQELVSNNDKYLPSTQHVSLLVTLTQQNAKNKNKN
jgi:hypothetical protein